MTTPLDRKVRKELVRLAERNPDYRTPARIILALSRGQDENQIADSLRVSVDDVRTWAKRYEDEGLTIFGDELEAEATSQTANTDYDDEPSDKDDERSDTPHSRRAMAAKRRRSRTSPPRRRRGYRDDYEDDESPISIDDAVAEGLEFLLDDDDDLDELELPQRKVVSIVEEGEETEQPASDWLEDRPDPVDPISVSALAAAFEVDMDHARHISKQARELFDATAQYHRLPTHHRDLLHAAALLHNIAHDLDNANHHILGRDLLLKYTLIDINSEERQLIAVMTALHRQSVAISHEPSYQNVPENLRHAAKTLSAILRIAVGLDYSYSQTSTISEWREAPGELIVVVGGREADTDAPRAQLKADLWNRLDNQVQLRFVTERQIETVDYVAQAPPRWPELQSTLSCIEVSNTLRLHYVERTEYLVERICGGDSGLLVSLWRELQRLTGIWGWLLPGAPTLRDLNEDSVWLMNLTQQALYSSALKDRCCGLLDETDPEQDDPEAIRGLKILCDYYSQLATQGFDKLTEALQSDRYNKWLDGIKTPLEDDDDDCAFGSQVAERAWAYLGELRQVMTRVKRAGWNADLETLLTIETVFAFEADLRRLTDLLTYGGSLLGAEHEQVLDVLEPLLDYVRSWVRMERVAQLALTTMKRQGSKLPPLVLEAFSTIMRERANEMRWNLPEMWEALNTTTFRRALALAVAKP